MKRLAYIFCAAAALTFATAATSSAAGLTVSAASSLAVSFREVASAFESSNPGVKVTINAGSSGALARQIAQGAPVDVFACADGQTMDMLDAKGMVCVGTRAQFAGNRLALVVPAANRGGVKSAKDLKGGRVKRVAVGKPETVPAGRYAKASLGAMGVWDALLPKLIYAENVNQALDYVRRGEVDAGIVYATDAAARKGEVTVVEILPDAGRPVVYPIAAISGCVQPELAGKFIAYVRSGAGRAILSAHGFTLPVENKR